MIGSGQNVGGLGLNGRRSLFSYLIVREKYAGEACVNEEHQGRYSLC